MNSNTFDAVNYLNYDNNGDEKKNRETINELFPEIIIQEEEKDIKKDFVKSSINEENENDEQDNKDKEISVVELEAQEIVQKNLKKLRPI